MAEKKISFAKALEHAFKTKARAEVKSIISQIKENGWSFIAVAFDGFISDNENWIMKAIEERKFFLANVFVDFETSLA